MARRIKPIVIPAAGLGTRLLPATRVTAKELLPVYDNPMLQFALDEAAASGAARVVIVISPDKLAICDYVLAEHSGPSRIADQSNLQRADAGEVVFTYQNRQLGLEHAIACARAFMLPGLDGLSKAAIARKTQLGKRETRPAFAAASNGMRPKLDLLGAHAARV